MKDILQNRLNTYYQVKTSEEELNALKEIVQEIVLYGLYQAGFFKETCFIGGTALRIIHSLNRFSEDLDFSTKEINEKFDLDFYLKKTIEAISPYGLDFKIDNRELADKTVQGRWLKDDSIKKILIFKYRQDIRQKIKVKIEVDTAPPKGANQKIEYVDFPDDFQVSCYTLSSLMAGKIHALLCRPYHKGRDWYDFLWYIKNGISPNMIFLENALKQVGPWASGKNKNFHFDKNFLREALVNKIEKMDFEDIKFDIKKFLLGQRIDSLDLWDKDFFLSKVSKIKF